MIALLFGVVGCSAGGRDRDTIRVVYADYSGNHQLDHLMRAVERQFEAANRGLKVRLDPIVATSDSYATRVDLMQRSAATAPDVLLEDSFNITADADAGYLLPLDKYLAGWPDWQHQFIDAAKQEGRSSDGHTYAVPIGTDSRGIWYNRDVFAKAGLPIPWNPKSWADVLSAARRIHAAEPGVEPMFLPLGEPQGEGVSMQTLEMLLYGTDTHNLYDPATRKWVAPSRGMTDALGFVSTVVRDHLAQTPVAAEDTQWTATEMDVLAAQNKIGFMLDGGWYAQAWNPGSFAAWPDWSKVMAVTAFPTQYGQPPGRVTLSGGWTLAVGARTGNPDAAFRFVATALDAPNSDSIDRSESWLPVRKDVQADPTLARDDPTEPFWASLVPITRFRPTNEQYPRVSAAMQLACDAVVNGADPKHAASQWVGRMRHIVGAANMEAG